MGMFLRSPGCLAASRGNVKCIMKIRSSMRSRGRGRSVDLFFVAMGSLMVKSKLADDANHTIHVGKTRKNHPSGNGSYHLFIYIYNYIYTYIDGDFGDGLFLFYPHQTPIGHGHIIAMRVSFWGPRQSVLRRSESMRSQGGPGR